MSKCVKCGNEILTGDIHWEMGLCNNCYNELYKDHKTHISLDKMWLELAISFRDENDELQNKITDLEAKLAEKEEQLLCKTWYKEYRNVMEANEGFYEECAKLREQLAEKERELNDICQNYDFQINDFSREVYRLQQREKVLEQQLAKKEKLLKKYVATSCPINQDKIELLEKVKSNLGWFPAITEEDIKIFKKKQMKHFRKRLMSYYEHNEECINTLIKEIKGE